MADAELQHIATLARSGDRAAAYTQVRAYVDRNARSIDGWWVAAMLAPTREDSVRAAQEVIRLDPKHTAAKRHIAEQTRLLADPEMIAKAKLAGKRQAPSPIRRRRRIITLLALILLSLSSLMGGMFATGNDFGLIGKSANTKNILSLNARSPSIAINSVFVNAMHEYDFALSSNQAVLLTVMFPLGAKNPAKAVRLFDDGGLRANANNGAANMGQIMFIADHDGIYRLQVSGVAGAAQGLFLITGAAQSIGTIEQ